jgi:hypothetical protein
MISMYLVLVELGEARALVGLRVCVHPVAVLLLIH